MYSRPFKRATSRHEEENEFASLWVERTILRTAYQAASSFPDTLSLVPVLSVAHPDTDPDQACQVNPDTDPDPACQVNPDTNPDPACQGNPDTDPVPDSDTDPGFC